MSDLKNIGDAMADAISTVVHCVTEAQQHRLVEDSDGLLPSDHIALVLAHNLERMGYKRI